MFINDLPECILSSLLYLFADDTKCFETITNLSDSNELQEDLKCIDGVQTMIYFLASLRQK